MKKLDIDIQHEIQKGLLILSPLIFASVFAWKHYFLGTLVFVVAGITAYMLLKDL